MINEERNGFIVCLITYLFWGVAPVFFKLFGDIEAVRIIAHRIIWGLGFLLLFLLIRDGRALLTRARITGRQFIGLFCTGVLVAGNWLVFVWAVNQGQILATSLGYFITPLVQILLGIVFLRERITRIQTISVCVAIASTIYLTVSMGGLPWIALTLAVSFGLYGLLRKQLAIRPLVGLAWETLLLLPAAILYLWLFDAGGSVNSPADPAGTGLMLLFVASGLVTVLPLIGFNYAAVRLKLSTIGFMQYLAPSVSFLIALFVYNEHFSLEYRYAFGGIWLALLILGTAPLINRFRRPNENAEKPPCQQH